ncbi:MAG TPA: gamma-glutamyl-gamma-aminobutyrate hydrolase family protein [Candidatus Xenobia bacterium]|jgi:putative glutamine amidotransferase
MKVVLTIGRDRKEKPYVEALKAVGLDCVVLEPGVAAEPWIHYLDEVRGLVMAGGSDIDPSLYRIPEPPHPTIDEPDAVRDHMERALFDSARAKDMPILGICRGVQVMNWAMGGDLYQDIDAHHEPENTQKKHRQTAYGKARHDVGHHVRLLPGTLLHRIIGSAEEIPVNTIHHQAVKVVAPGLTVNAISVEDGLVEGLEWTPGRFCLGVQWHPECLWDKPQTASSHRIFEAFSAAVKG